MNYFILNIDSLNNSFDMLESGSKIYFKYIYDVVDKLTGIQTNDLVMGYNSNFSTIKYLFKVVEYDNEDEFVFEKIFDIASDFIIDDSNIIETLETENVYPLDEEEFKRYYFKLLGSIPEYMRKEYEFASNTRDNFKRNVIYFGAPGTGKSFKLDEDKDDLLGIEFRENYKRVTFHPDYSYANFVGTYKPVPIEEKQITPQEDEEIDKEKSSISYDYVPGPFMRLLVDALKKPDEPFLLIIEEINRANVAAVFGDVFQLLDRRSKGEHLEYSSKFSINTTNDMKRYLKEELLDVKEDDEEKKAYFNEVLGENFERIIIPENMYIWATMNSADQGVFPMDTAFKRRWDFRYFRVYPKDEDELKNLEVSGVDSSWGVPKDKIKWHKLRRLINDKLLEYGVNEDKLLGPYFAFNEYDDNIPFTDFKEIFKNKIIMYLFEDAARSKSDKLFNGVKGRNIYSTICDEFDDNGVKIFCDEIKNPLLVDDDE